MEILIFSLNAVVVYLLADSILLQIERRRGEPLRQRQIVFFGIFLVLIMTTFALFRIWF